MSFKILFFGDIIGSLGRRGVVAALPDLRKEYAPDLVIANVENLAHGKGVTPKVLSELDRAGVDAYTSGNHVWQNPLGLPCFEDPIWKNRFVRPGNVIEKRAGKGVNVIEKNGVSLLLVNLMGQLFMKDEVENAFHWIDRTLSEAPKTNLVLIDFHTETTSEKEAFGHFVDGRATGVFGTHTHVPTADAKILPGGTAYITDVGRNGGHDSVVGFEKGPAVQRFVSPGSKAFDPTDSGPVEVNAVLLEADVDSGHGIALRHIHKIIDV